MAQQVKASLEKRLNGMTAKPGANGTVGETAKEAGNAKSDDDNARANSTCAIVDQEYDGGYRNDMRPDMASWPVLTRVLLCRVSCRTVLALETILMGTSACGWYLVGIMASFHKNKQDL